MGHDEGVGDGDKKMSEDIRQEFLDRAKALENEREPELDTRRETNKERGEGEGGPVDPQPDCEKCKGTGSVNCHRCSGTGEDICIYCDGSGWTLVGIPPLMTLCFCRKGKVGCVACNGKRTKPCACTLAEK